MDDEASKQKAATHVEKIETEEGKHEAEKRLQEERQQQEIEKAEAVQRKREEEEEKIDQRLRMQTQVEEKQLPQSDQRLLESKIKPSLENAKQTPEEVGMFNLCIGNIQFECFCCCFLWLLRMIVVQKCQFGMIPRYCLGNVKLSNVLQG